MTLLDRYISRQFIISAVFGLLAFLLIFLVIDMMEKLDDFIDAHAPLQTVVVYYMAFSPEIIKLMTPVALLLAALFVTGRLSTQNELAAMKSSGVSLYRILMPFLVIALLVSAGSFYLNGWVVPNANQKKYYIEKTLLRQSSDPSNRFNIFFQEGPTRIVSISYYDTESKMANRVSIQDFADTNFTALLRRFDAPQMQWQETGWVLLHGTERTFTGDAQQMELFARHPVGKLTLAPADIKKKQRRPDEMDYEDLQEFIANQQRAGQDVSRWLVDFHAKLAFPFASVIMVLFGVPFAASRPRTGAALGFGICVAVTFIYLGFMKASQVFGYNGDLDPLLTAWLANIIFLIAAVGNLMRVQK
ncbi:MAG: LPS export ABC transporter permease LptG [Bacteroidota bacterium]